MIRAVPVVALLLALTCSARAETLARWTEMVGAAQSVRVIATGACPSLQLADKQVALVQRSPADEPFPVLSCQASLPVGTAAPTLDGQRLPVLPATVNRIVVIGDTGCRIKGQFVQDCNDKAAWPFAAIAAQAATEQPDLVIHVGDYYYRESACPSGRAGCAGSPHGDDWAAWDADFFTPAKPLLAAAPWIMVRGNHEQCGRGGLGWFRFLDAHETPLTCPASEAPFTVTLGALRLFVLDSADTEDAVALPNQVALFRKQLDAIKPLDESGFGLILTHRPFWGFVPDRSGAVGDKDDLPTNRNEQAAAHGDALAGVQMILSGHVHIFSASDFGGVRPAQLIVGVGGDTRDGAQPGVQAHKISIAGIAASSAVVEQFGYFVFDRTGEDWQGVLKGQDGTALARCTLHGRALACAAP